LTLGDVSRQFVSVVDSAVALRLQVDYAQVVDGLDHKGKPVVAVHAEHAHLSIVFGFVHHALSKQNSPLVTGEVRLQSGLYLDGRVKLFTLLLAQRNFVELVGVLPFLTFRQYIGIDLHK